MLKQATNLIAWLVSGALLFGALGIVVFATPLFGNRALIVRSGSMEPAISVGDVVIVRAGEYQTGDAIAYNVPGREDPAFAQGYGGRGMVVTHRIQEVREGAQGFEYITKGDANPEADSWVVTEGDIIGEELFVVPWVGTLLAFAKSRIGFMSLVVAPALVVVLSEVRVIWREMRKKVPVLEMGNPPFIPPLSRRESTDTSLDKGRLGGVSLPKPVYVSALSFVGNPPPPIRTFVDGVVRRSVSLAALLFMFSVMTPATFALYTDTGTSSNNVFTAADDFGGGTDHVVFSEILTDANEDNDFIELYNPTDSPIDLEGWQIKKKTSSGATISSVVVIGNDVDDVTVIPAHGFWLWANDDSIYAADADAVRSVTVVNNNSIALFNDDPTPIIVDQVNWGGGTNQFVEGNPFTPNPGADDGLERKALSGSTAATMASGGTDELKGNGFDSNNNETDFVLHDGFSNPQNTGSATEEP